LYLASQVEGIGGLALGELQQASGVVVVAVTEGDGVGCGDVDVELLGVVFNGEALPGVPEEAVLVGFHPDGESVFGEESGTSDTVFA